MKCINGLHLTLFSHRGGALFLEINTCSFSANTTLTGKLYLCSQTLAVMVKTIGMYKWTARNPIKP